jgi:flagellar protein FlaG
MNLDVAPVAPSSYSAIGDSPSSQRRTRPAPLVRDAVPVDTIPSSPPHEVLDAMDAASRAYQALRAQGRQLHFSQNEETGRMTIEVRDLDGKLLRMIPPSELLDIATATGKRLD